MNLEDELGKVSLSKHQDKNVKTLKKLQKDQLETGELASKAIMESLRYALEDIKVLYQNNDIFELDE
jgi:hypothetical protein